MFTIKYFINKYTACLLAIMILAAVPFARKIQYCFNALLTQLGIPFQMVYLSCLTAALIVLFFFYYTLFKRQKLAFIATHLFVLILCSLMIVLIIGEIWVEYTHILTYGLLYFFLRSAFFGEKGKYQPLKTIAVLCLVSLSDEILQGIHPDRVFDLRDLELNLLGGTLGLLLYEALLREPGRRVPRN